MKKEAMVLHGYEKLSGKELGRVALFDTFLYMLRAGSSDSRNYKMRLTKAMQRVSSYLYAFVDLQDVVENSLSVYKENGYETIFPSVEQVMNVLVEQGQMEEYEIYMQYMAICAAIRNYVSMGIASKNQVEVGFFRLVMYYQNAMEAERVKELFSLLPGMLLGEWNHRMQQNDPKNALQWLKMIDPYLEKNISEEDLGLHFEDAQDMQEQKGELICQIREHTLIDGVREVHAYCALLSILGEQEGLPLEMLLDDALVYVKKQCKTISTLLDEDEKEAYSLERKKAMESMFPPIGVKLQPTKQAMQQAKYMIEKRSVFLTNPNVPLAVLLTGGSQ